MKFKFKELLIEGLIKSRPNRFLMNVEIEGKISLCHCPTTGRIGDLSFEDVPCLVSKSENEKRRTAFTVEAISLDSLSKKNKSWIGINQMKINRYVEFFLKNKDFSKMVKSGEVQREKPLGNSRIDFLIEDVYLEVKMPLIMLPTNSGNKLRKHSKFDSFDRLIKHFDDLAKHLKKGKKAIVLLAYMYPAKPFTRPEKDKTNSRILSSARKAQKKGLENWQANFKISKTGVELKDYFRLGLF